MGRYWASYLLMFPSVVPLMDATSDTAWSMTDATTDCADAITCRTQQLMLAQSPLHGLMSTCKARAHATCKS